MRVKDVKTWLQNAEHVIREYAWNEVGDKYTQRGWLEAADAIEFALDAIQALNGERGQK